MLVRRGDDLVLIGDGDPTLGDAEMLRKVGWDVDTVFRNWATAFKNRGALTVHDVVVDDSVFDQNFLHCNWPTEQQHKRYVAQVGGMQLNCNCIDFWLKTTSYGEVVRFVTDPPALGEFATIKNNCITGRDNSVWLSREPGGNSIILRGQTNASSGEPVSVTVNDPPMYAASVLAETFKSEGVKITGTVRRDRTVRASIGATDGGTSLVAVHETPLPAGADDEIGAAAERGQVLHRGGRPGQVSEGGGAALEPARHAGRGGRELVRVNGLEHGRVGDHGADVRA